MSFHSKSVAGNNHAVTAATYADIAARDADTAFHIADNVDKIVRVSSPLAYYVMTATTPAWTETSAIALPQPLDTTDEVTFASVTIDNLKLDGNTLSSTDTNGDINLAANGTGDVILPSGTNLGIGVAPQVAMHVNGTIRGSVLQIDDVQIDGTTLSTFAPNADLLLTPNGTGDVVIGNVTIDPAGTIKSTNNNNLIFNTDGGTGKVVFTAAFQCSQSASILGTLYGGTTPSENLVMESTEDVTKGNIQMLDDVAMSKNLSITGNLNGIDPDKLITNVSGTGSDNSLVRFDGGSGNVQPSSIKATDTNQLTGVTKLQGSSASGGDITISSTSHVTKGDVFFDDSNISAVNNVTIDGTLLAAVATITNDITINGQLLAKVGAVTPGISFDGDSDTGLGTAGSNQIYMICGGTNSFTITSSQFKGSVNFSAAFQNEGTTSTNPTLLPDRNTLDAGLGGRAGDLSLITAGAQRVEINAAGKVKHVNYTNLGSDAPAIRMKKLTGTTGTSEGDNTDIAHGLTASKILAVDVLIELDTANSFMPPGYIDSSEKQYDFFFDATNVGIRLHATNSAQLLGNAIKILITYEE